VIVVGAPILCHRARRSRLSLSVCPPPVSVSQRFRQTRGLSAALKTVRLLIKVFGHVQPTRPNHRAAGALGKFAVPRGQIAQLLRVRFATLFLVLHGVSRAGSGAPVLQARPGSPISVLM
jgi:hypothetical protein